MTPEAPAISSLPPRRPVAASGRAPARPGEAGNLILNPGDMHDRGAQRRLRLRGSLVVSNGLIWQAPSSRRGCPVEVRELSLAAGP